jgi:hypothetical protein
MLASWHHARHTVNMRKLSWALLLPFFLLFAQQGELRHEYSHYGQAPAGSQQKAPADAEHCSLCLAYAHLSGAAKTEVVAPVLLSDLAFHYARAFEVASADTEAASPRSRGPPSL